MAVPTRTSGDDPLLDEALDWVVRLKAGTPTRADVDTFSCWRRQSDAHEQALRAAVRLYRLAGAAARELADENAARAALPSRLPPPLLLARRAALAGAIAAAAGYVMVRPPFGLWPSIGELSADYRTGKGERRRIAVAPDVSLELNTQTSIAVRSAADETQIELISGEAWVASETGPSKPFVMLAGNGRIIAAHANFDGRCFGMTVTVTCLDGAVIVEQGGTTITLQRTQQVTYSENGLRSPVVVDTAQVSAWQAGLLVFRDRPLDSVVEEINRYRSGKIIIASDSLRRRLVSGTYQLDKLDNFVAQVEQLFGARIMHLPGGVVFMTEAVSEERKRV
jgi:transmembrane sensor